MRLSCSKQFLATSSMKKKFPALFNDVKAAFQAKHDGHCYFLLKHYFKKYHFTGWSVITSKMMRS